MREGWTYKKLGEYIEECSVKNKQNESIPVYSVTNSQGFCKEYFNKEVASQDKSTYKIVPYGAFAYNPSRINVGSVDWQDKEEKVIVSPLYNVFIVSPEIDKDYLLYYIKSANTMNLINSLATGTVRLNLKLSMLKEFIIPLPPKSQQEAIVSELDEINSLLALKREQLQKYDKLAQSLFYEMFGDPIENEKGWEVKKYGEEFEIGSGGTPSKIKIEYWENGNIPWIGSNMCQNCVINETDGKYITQSGLEHSSAKLLSKGTVLVALVGATIGKVALLKTETSTNQNIAFIKVSESDNYVPEFVYFHLMSMYGEFMNIGNGDFKMANLSFVRSLPIPLPPFSLQQQFASRIEQIESQKQQVQAAIEKLETLLASRMQYWFE